MYILYNNFLTQYAQPIDRKKNRNDPITNPIYFFKKPNDEKAIKLVSLNNFNEKIKEIHKNNINKVSLLQDAIIETKFLKKKGEKYINRPKSVTGISKFVIFIVLLLNNRKNSTKRGS